MKIYGNENLLVLRADIDEVQKKFSSELELINNEFTPTFVQLKKRKSNISYYIVLTLFLFIFISLAVFLGVLEAFYLILIVYGINLGLTVFGYILYRKTNKHYLEYKTEYDKKYKDVLKFQEQAEKLFEQAKQEIYKVIVMSKYHEKLESLKSNQSEYQKFFNNALVEVKQEIEREIGENPTGEALLIYYDEWGAKFIGQDNSSYDFLEARRRKAQLRSKNVDIE